MLDWLDIWLLRATETSAKKRIERRREMDFGSSSSLSNQPSSLLIVSLEIDQVEWKCQFHLLSQLVLGFRQMDRDVSA